MAEIMHDVVKTTITKVVMKTTNCISISYDEVISVDNHNWLSLHKYVIKDWSWILIMVSLESLP
jgi:hypothetical protein